MRFSKLMSTVVVTMCVCSMAYADPQTDADTAKDAAIDMYHVNVEPMTDVTINQYGIAFNNSVQARPITSSQPWWSSAKKQQFDAMNNNYLNTFIYRSACSNGYTSYMSHLNNGETYYGQGLYYSAKNEYNLAYTGAVDMGYYYTEAEAAEEMYITLRAQWVSQYPNN